MTLAARLHAAVEWRLHFLRTPIGIGIVSRCYQYPGVFHGAGEALRYARVLCTSRPNTPPCALRLRALGGRSILCRPLTSDPWVLWDTFHSQFQAPPSEVPDPKVIVDLGANVGYTSAYFAARFPAARVLGVEMDRDNVLMACRNVHEYGDRCTMVHAAVWHEDAHIEYGGDEEQGFRVAPLSEGHFVKRGTVDARALDSLLTEYHLDTVDYLKMDIEGAEAMVFRGRLDWVTRVRAMKIELHPPATYAECCEILTRHGFECRPDDRHDHGLVAIRRVM